MPLWHTDFCSQQNKLIHAVVSIVLICESQIPLDVGEVCRRSVPLRILIPTASLFKDKHGVFLCRGGQGLSEETETLVSLQSFIFKSLQNKNRNTTLFFLIKGPCDLHLKKKEIKPVELLSAVIQIHVVL